MARAPEWPVVEELCLCALSAAEPAVLLVLEVLRNLPQSPTTTGRVWQAVLAVTTLDQSPTAKAAEAEALAALLQCGPGHDPLAHRLPTAAAPLAGASLAVARAQVALALRTAPSQRQLARAVHLHPSATVPGLYIRAALGQSRLGQRACQAEATLGVLPVPPVARLRTPAGAVTAALRAQAAAVVPQAVQLPAGACSGGPSGRHWTRGAATLPTQREALRWIHADPASASARLAAARLGLKHLTCATAPSPERCRAVGHLAEGAAATWLGDRQACVGDWAWSRSQAQGGKKGIQQVALVCAAEANLRASHAAAPEDQPLAKRHLDNALKLANKATQCQAGKTAVALCQVARCEGAAGTKESALAHYREALEVAASGAERLGVLLEAAHAEFLFNSYEEAKQHVSEAAGTLEQGPDEKPLLGTAAHVAQAQLLATMDQPKEANACLTRARASLADPSGWSLNLVGGATAVVLLQAAMGLGHDKTPRQLQRIISQPEGVQPHIAIAQQLLASM